MLLAEKLRDERIAKLTDLELLRVLAKAADDGELTEVECSMCADYFAVVRSGRALKKGRPWAEQVARRVMPLKAAEVPQGRHVPTPAVLLNLPKKPPGVRP